MSDHTGNPECMPHDAGGLDELSRIHRALERDLAALAQRRPPDHSDLPCIERLVTALAVHEVVERHCLYPRIERLLDDGAALAAEAAVRRDRIADQIIRLGHLNLDTIDFDLTLRALATATHTHIRHHENEVFPHFRECCTVVELRQLARELRTTLARLAATTPSTSASATKNGNPTMPPLHAATAAAVRILSHYSL